MIRHNKFQCLIGEDCTGSLSRYIYAFMSTQPAVPSSSIRHTRTFLPFITYPDVPSIYSLLSHHVPSLFIITYSDVPSSLRTNSPMTITPDRTTPMLITQACRARQLPHFPFLPLTSVLSQHLPSPPSPSLHANLPYPPC